MQNYDDETLFRKRCYELYQLDWMMSHGYSLQDAFNLLREGYAEGCASGNINRGTDWDNDFDAMEEYFEEQGFYGALFVCEDEFYACEYRDPEYMKHLLPENMQGQYFKLMEMDEDMKTGCLHCAGVHEHLQKKTACKYWNPEHEDCTLNYSDIRNEAIDDFLEEMKKEKCGEHYHYVYASDIAKIAERLKEGVKRESNTTILFNTDMVRAILDGRKTVTRRLVKP